MITIRPFTFVSEKSRRAASAVSLLFLLSVGGCGDTIHFVGAYSCSASPMNKDLNGIVHLQPSFTFQDDGSIEYTLENPGGPPLTYFGHYKVDDNELRATYKKSRIGNLSADDENMTVRYTIVDVSKDKFSLEQKFNSEEADNLWKLTCDRGI